MPDTPEPAPQTNDLRVVYPEDYADALERLGTTAEFANPDQQTFAVAEVLRRHALAIFDKAHDEKKHAEGITVDGALAERTIKAVAKAHQVTLDDAAIAELAQYSGAYDQPGAALKHLEADLTAYDKGKTADMSRYFDSPNRS